MAAFLSLAKTVGPLIVNVINATEPFFTKEKKGKSDQLVVQQISELQEAVRSNSENTQTLARAIESAARTNDQVMKRALFFVAVAAAAAFLALGVSLVALLK